MIKLLNIKYMEVFIIQFFYCYLETTKRWLLSSPVTISMRSISCNLWGFYFTFPYLSSHFRFWFRPHFSSACGHPSTFILQRYRRQGIRKTPEQVLLTENFSWPSEIKDCGFLKTFTGQLFALCPLNACDVTLHIKGSRWRLHRNDKKKFGSKKRKNYKKVENRDAQNKY